MAWAFSDLWRLWSDIATDARSVGVQNNAIASGGSHNTTTFDYFDDAAVVDDYLYIALSSKFWGVRFYVGTAFVADSVTFVWEYYDGSAWQTLNVTNENAFLNAGSQDVTFTPPLGWKGAGADKGGYCIRCRISAVTNISEGGAQSTNKLYWNLKNLEVTGTVTDGLVGARTADYAGTYTILPATTSAVGIPTLEMPTNEILDASFVDVILSGTTAGAGDTVDINGTDLEGNALTETIDVSGGDATYTSTKQYRNITTIDANGFSDGTIQVDMKRWGIISGNNPYLVKAHLGIGDGSTATSFTMDNTLLRISPGFHFFLNEGTWIAGDTVGSGNIEASQNGSSIFEEIDTYIGAGCVWNRVFGTSTMTMKGCTFYIKTTGYQNKPIYTIKSGTLDYQDCDFNVVGTSLIDFSCGANIPTMNRVRFNGVAFAASTSGADKTAVGFVSSTQMQIQNRINFTFDDCHYSAIKIWPYAKTLICLDSTEPTFQIGWAGVNSAANCINIKYRLDLKVIDNNGDGIENATVAIDDVDGTEIFSGVTDANGDIAQQEILQKYADWVKSDTFYWYTMTPHTITITKSGYKKRTFKLTMDRKREEVEKLEKSGNINLSGIVGVFD